MGVFFFTCLRVQTSKYRYERRKTQNTMVTSTYLASAGTDTHRFAELSDMNARLRNSRLRLFDLLQELKVLNRLNPP